MTRHQFTAGTFSLIVLATVLAGLAADRTDPAIVTPSSQTASSTLAIIGPGDSLAPGEETYLRIEGLTLAEVEQAQDAHLFDLTAFPLKGLKIKSSYDWMFRTLDLQFHAKYPGSYLVKLHLVRDGKLEIAAIVVKVAGQEPDPPNPTPPPPGPLAEMWAIVVEETAERTPAQARTLLDPAIRQWVKDNGHHLRIVDKDQQATDLQEWIERAVAPGVPALPRLFLVDGASGAVSFEGPLPDSPKAMLALLKEHGRTDK